MQNFSATPHQPSTTLRGRMLHWLSLWGRRLWRSFCFPFQSRRSQVTLQAKASRNFPHSRRDALRQHLIVQPLEEEQSPGDLPLTEVSPEANTDLFEKTLEQAMEPSSDSIAEATFFELATVEVEEPQRSLASSRFKRRGITVSQSAAASADLPFDWVLDHRIAIGPLPRKAWLADFEAQGIQSIISLCAEAEGKLPKVMTQQFRCVRVSLPDSRYRRSLTLCELEEAVDLLHWNVQKQQPVYLHCLAGIERSPLVAIAYLSRYRSMDLLDAVSWLSHVHEKSRPTSAQLKVVRQYLSQA